MTNSGSWNNPYLQPPSLDFDKYNKDYVVTPLQITPGPMPTNPQTGAMYLDEETSEFRIFIASQWYTFQLTPVKEPKKQMDLSRFKKVIEETEDE